MNNLNDKIVAYLSINNIPQINWDYETGIPPNGVDQILYWNEQKLGAIPATEQLNSAYTIWEGQQIAKQNKETAKQLLVETDWAAIPEVSNPEKSNPYLMNQNEFSEYRSTLRQIAVNPPTTPAVFPEKPQEQWSN